MVKLVINLVLQVFGSYFKSSDYRPGADNKKCVSQAPARSFLGR